MVNVKRIEFSHDGVTFTETFSNNQYITTIIEEDSIVTDEGFSYGDTPTIATLTLRYAGTSVQVAEMLSYKHMRVYVNNVLVFSGYNPSNDEEVISSEYRQGSATYSSYASYFETVTFESDIYYSQPDGIKVCDPQDTSHSLVHIIANMLFETAPQAFTLECSYRDTTVVPAFTASIGDSIYSVLCELLEQAGLTFYIKSYTLYVIDMLEEPSGVASNITDFESGMQLSEKAYESKTLPMLRTCNYHTATDITIGTQFTKEQKMVVNPHASIEAPVSLKYDAGDNTEVVLYTPTDVSLVGATEGIISGYGVVLRSWEKTASNQITAQVYNEHAVFNYSYKNIKVTGNVVYLDYNNLVVPQFSDTNMSFTVQRNEEKTNYLSSTSQALRYLRALLYGKYMDAKTYTVYTTVNLDLNDFCTIHGEPGYYRVIQKQCAYDHFGGYTYTVAAIYNDAGLHYSASYVAPVADLPTVSPGIVLEASRYTVEYDPNGRLLSNIPIRITLRSLNTFLNPTLRINGEAVTPALAPSDSGTTDETTVGDSGWYYDVDPHYFDMHSEMTVSADINYSNYTAIRIIRTSLQPVKIIQQYYVSTSTEEPSGGTWLDTKPLTYAGYLWRRTGTVYTDGSTVYEEPYYILAPQDISYTSVVEYAVSSSSETFVFPDAVIGYGEDTLGADDFEFGFKNYTWSSDIRNWYKGLYVWQRIKITDAEGVVTYGEPTYCKEITEGLVTSCKFELVVDNSEFVVDKSQNGSSQYSARLVVTGYSDSALATVMQNISVLNEDGSSTGISNVSYSTYRSGVIAFNISKSTDSMQIKISVDGLYGESASALMSAKDITSYVMFAGCVTTNTLPVTRFDGTNLVKDDYFIAGIEITTYPAGWSAIDSDDRALSTISKGTPFIYIGNQTWKKIGSMTNMDIAMGCLGGILDAGVDMTDSNNMYYTWLVNLVAQNAVIANLFTKNLVFSKDGIMWGGDVTVDAGGRPVKTANSYTIGNGGGFVIDASGFFQCKEALIESATIHDSTVDGSSVINGTIENYDATSGEVVFKTSKISQSPIQLKASKIDGTSVPAAYSKQEWYDVLNSWLSGLDENVSYDATGSIFNVVSALFVRRSVGGAKTKVVNKRCSGSSPGQWRWDNDTGQQIYVSAEINGNYTAGFLWVDQYNSRIDVSVYNSDGTIYSTPIHREPISARYQSSKTGSFYIPKGGYVVGTVAGGGGQSYYVNSGYFYLYYSESENFGEGINIIYDSKNHILLSDIPRTGYGTSDTYLNVDNVVKSITMTADSTWEVNKYYRFSYTSGYAPTNTSFAVTSLLSNADFEFPDGTTRTIAYIKYKSDELAIYTTDGDSYDFLTANENYYRSHEIDISVMSAILGAFAQNLMPIYNSNAQRVGSGYVGSETEPWYQGWAETGWLQGSARARKENIERLNDNAVEIIRGVDVVSFTYKCDKGNPKGYRHYGFIADDTDERLSSPFHNVMEIGNCIGILLKAVQELAAKIDELEGDKK